MLKRKKNIVSTIRIFFTHNFRVFFISYFLILGGIFLIILSFGSTIISEYNYYLDQVLRKHYVLQDNNTKKLDESIFKKLVSGPTVELAPPKPDSIVIEKIGVAAPVIWNVSVTDEKEYFEALKQGVAHARGKAKPGESGNIYLFAHSSIEFWKMGPYATVFNQLRRLDVGDKIYLFKQGVRYDYSVYQKQTVSGFDLSPYEATYSDSVLTLQTCDPPGTQLNRLIVLAR